MLTKGERLRRMSRWKPGSVRIKDQDIDLTEESIPKLINLFKTLRPEVVQHLYEEKDDLWHALHYLVKAEWLTTEKISKALK